MKVRELIQRLERENPDAEVYVQHRGHFRAEAATRVLGKEMSKIAPLARVIPNVGAGNPDREIESLFVTERCILIECEGR